MRQRLGKTSLALVLAIQLLLSQLPMPAVAEEGLPPAQTGAAAETQPEESQPEESQPEESQPEESRPEESQPEESQPEESQPEESQPEESQPEESQPEESQPEESQPEETPPEESQPEESQPEESQPEESLPEEPLEVSLPPEASEPKGPGLYFGQLHAHTDFWGDTPADAFAAAAQVEGLDFFALTDHGHFLKDEAQWAAGKAAAREATTGDFLALYGYEMSWPAQMQLGHIGALATSGFHSWKQPEFSGYEDALSNYYRTLAQTPGAIGQFNHPSTRYGSFLELSYVEAADSAMALLEIDSGSLDAYFQALDQGWHVAPSGGQNSRTRTVVWGEQLTEEGLYQALRQRRTYVTQDPDLELRYSINGHRMGSRLEQRDLGTAMQLSLAWTDPTGDGLGQVEVVTTGGWTLARQTHQEASGTLTVSLDPEEGYYLLRITQPDGDRAVTAPIWVEDTTLDLGIKSLMSQTETPVQHEAVVLDLTLYNAEREAFLVESLTLLANGEPVAEETLEQLAAGEEKTLSIPLRWAGVGPVRITAALAGTLDGTPHRFEAALDLTFRQSKLVNSLLADGSHGNPGLEELSAFGQMAAAEGLELNIQREPMTAEALQQAGVLLLSVPGEPFSAEFLSLVGDYARYGGSLVVCGQGQTSGTAELNRVLEAAGSTVRLGNDLVTDPLNNGGSASVLYAETINREASWCSGSKPGQTFLARDAASVHPGSGTWLVKGFGEADAPVLLACEELPGGGTVIVSGCPFLTEEALKKPENLWAQPFLNRTLAQAILGIEGARLPLSTIGEARANGTEAPVRIRGYVTAGTSNAHNRFPEGIYVQDGTGGIAAGPILGEPVQQGAAVELTGTVVTRQGIRYLQVSSWKALDAPMRQWPAGTDAWPQMQAQEGSLAQVEGRCIEIYCWDSGILEGCLLEDRDGNRIRLRVAEHIGNGSDGANELHKFVRKGRTIRATGLVWVDGYGERVLRIRNCEEVVFVPPRNPPPFNAPTGDTALPAPLGLMALSALGLCLLSRFKMFAGSAGRLSPWFGKPSGIDPRDS